jgi:hypothetical protein
MICGRLQATESAARPDCSHAPLRFGRVEFVWLSRMAVAAGVAGGGEPDWGGSAVRSCRAYRGTLAGFPLGRTGAPAEYMGAGGVNGAGPRPSARSW